MRKTATRWIVNTLVLGSLVVFGLRARDEAQNEFRFAVVGDRTGGAQPQIYGRVWREIGLFHPEFVVNVGDTIQGGGDDVAQEQWDKLRPLFDRYRHYPLYFTPGNHDVFSEFSRTLYEKESKRPSHYSFDYGNAHFTILDTARTRDLPGAELDFLEQDLEANRNKEPKIVVFHHPYWDEAILNDEDFRLHTINKKYGVDYVLSGHEHHFARMIKDGIPYMKVGSSGGQMTGRRIRGGGFRDGAFYHWVWGHIQGNKVEFTVKEIGGMFGKGRIFPANQWDRNGPKFPVDDPALVGVPET